MFHGIRIWGRPYFEESLLVFLSLKDYPSYNFIISTHCQVIPMSFMRESPLFEHDTIYAKFILFGLPQCVWIRDVAVDHEDAAYVVLGWDDFLMDIRASQPCISLVIKYNPPFYFTVTRFDMHGVAIRDAPVFPPDYIGDRCITVIRDSFIGFLSNLWGEQPGRVCFSLHLIFLPHFITDSVKHFPYFEHVN